jgi:hypothetical protein
MTKIACKLGIGVLVVQRVKCLAPLSATPIMKRTFEH